MLKRNLFSISVISVLALLVIFFAALFILFVFKDIRIEKDRAAKCKSINKFIKTSKMPLMEDSISILEGEKNKLKSVYSRLKLALTSPLTEEISPESMDPLQFKEKLIRTQKKLREEAKDFSLVLPESIGFAKYEAELSLPSEIPLLLRRLRVMDELIYLMTLTGISSIDDINFIEETVKKEKSAVPAPNIKGKKPPPIPYNSKEEHKPAIYDEIIISFKVTCTYSELIDFLYKLKSSPFIFIVDDLDIAKTKDILDVDEAAESMLQAEFLVKAEIIH